MVVSAATGVFGMGKNVLDVWCNTTFLGEDGENVEIVMTPHYHVNTAVKLLEIRRVVLTPGVSSHS